MKKRWGYWQLDSNVRVLRSDFYEIDLDKCSDSAEILDWIAQVMKKRWATPEVIYNLIKALDDIFHIQASFCSMGQSFTLTSEQIQQYIERYARVE